MSPAAVRAGGAVGAAALAFLVAGWGALAGFGLSLALTFAGMPLFRRYALARPNARSSHKTPIPQGGGAAIVIATLAMALYGSGLPGPGGDARLLGIVAGALLLVGVGACDDIWGVPVVPRLGLQFCAVAIVVFSAVAGRPGLSPLPWPLEAVIMLVGGVWLVNLTNFIDGIDGITLAGFIPLAAAASVLGGMTLMSPVGAFLSVAFLGALCGFVWFNLPRAMLFMGDAGSLPIGLLGGALLLDMAQHGALAAALILPLYHAADATLTLLARLLRRERVWEAHRQHAYQRAVDGGWSHGRVSGLVLALNAGLAGLAILSTKVGVAGQFACVTGAIVGVTGLLILFRRQGV
jgi:UDP-N-acetylmuramyl pentapeptide phosphotransferase/UDP-N-acetylglucosamine-1-phosphate transferase